MRITVVGSGSWGTALAVLLGRNGHHVALAGRDPEEVQSVASLRENIRYLPGFRIPETVTPSLLEVTDPGELTVVAVPAMAVSQALKSLPRAPEGIVLACKGIESATGKLPSQMVEAVRVSAISGPNLATEIMRGIPTAAVIASQDAAFAEQVATLFNCRTFRAYISDDLVGVELAGALKNVLAISAGMSDGLGFGDNTKGALVARGLLEMCRLGSTLGGTMATFLGIAGVGDLFATANSKLSRNYRVGFGLGQGQTLSGVLAEIGQVAEGVGTAEAATMLARRHQISVPIFEMTDAVIRGRLHPRDGVTMLMDRMPKSEGWETLNQGERTHP